MKRLFLAVPVTLFDYQSIQADFDDIIQGKWVRIQNLHLTLKFFGDKFEQEYLLERLSSLQFEIDSSELNGLKCFKDKPVLYAKTENPSLLRLHEQVEEVLDLPYDQDFVPHVTLMRIKKIPHKELFEQGLHRYDKQVIGTLQPTVQLIQSHLSQEGAHYTLLHEFTKKHLPD